MEKSFHCLEKIRQEKKTETEGKEGKKYIGKEGKKSFRKINSFNFVCIHISKRICFCI
jgi:hypothetical protein